MPTSATYEVQPAGGLWEIKMAGDGQREVAGSREAAVARARELVGRYATGRVVVRGAGGQVEREYVHGPPEAERGR